MNEPRDKHRNKPEKEKYHMTSLIYRILKKKKKERKENIELNLQNRKRFTGLKMSLWLLGGINS